MIGQLIEINENNDERGMLMAINCIPFKAERMFFIFDVPDGAERGNLYSKTSEFLYVVIRDLVRFNLIMESKLKIMN